MNNFNAILLILSVKSKHIFSQLHKLRLTRHKLNGSKSKKKWLFYPAKRVKQNKLMWKRYLSTYFLVLEACLVRSAPLILQPPETSHQHGAELLLNLPLEVAHGSPLHLHRRRRFSPLTSPLRTWRSWPRPPRGRGDGLQFSISAIEGGNR